MRIGILTSGGDAQGMNSAIRAVGIRDNKIIDVENNNKKSEYELLNMLL